MPGCALLYTAKPAIQAAFLFQETKIGNSLDQQAGHIYQPRRSFSRHSVYQGGAQRVKWKEIGDLFCSSGIAILLGDKKSLPSHFCSDYIIWLWGTLLGKASLGHTGAVFTYLGTSSFVNRGPLGITVLCSLHPIFVVTRFLDELIVDQPRSSPFSFPPFWNAYITALYHHLSV